MPLPTSGISRGVTGIFATSVMALCLTIPHPAQASPGAEIPSTSPVWATPPPDTPGETFLLAQASPQLAEEPEAAAETEDPWEDAAEKPAEALSEAKSSGEEAKTLEEFHEIFGVQFDRNSHRDRVAILGDGPLRHHVFEPNEETLVVIVSGAVLAGDSGERLTPESGGPVSQVTIFQQPDVSDPEVRVVVRRAKGQDPDVRQRGSLLLVDFENTGSIATLPPALVPDLAASEGAGKVAVAGDEVGAPVLPSRGEVTDNRANGDDAWEGDGSMAPVREKEWSAVDMLGDGIDVDGKEYRGRKISLDMKDVPVTDVLRLIADVSELNIIAGDEVRGTITLRLLDVPWDQALDVILITKSLGFVRVGNVLRIAPAEDLKAENAVRLQERREKEQLEDLEVELLSINYASVADVKSLLDRLLTARGTVNVDERTNTVIIKDIPSVVAEATALIEALDTPTPQVMIEAKIVEASLDFGRELGSNWSIGVDPETAGFVAPQTGGVTWDGLSNVAVGSPITAVSTGAVNMGFLLLDDQMRVDLHVQAMEQTGQGKVISSPRIVTLDNKEAVIEQGVTIPFQTFEGGDAALEFIDAVLSLKVTPHITPDLSIIMSIEVTRNAPDASVPTPTGSPAIAKNQAKTETLVMNGQTLVIGGIYTIDTSDNESRVPYLHRIPILGAAFRTRSQSDTRKELLIFVTPRVVEIPGLSDR